jgi:hypothetical protein
VTSSSRLHDIFIYDAPSGTSLGERNSDLSDGLYYPTRLLLDRGLAVSGDGTRMVSAWLTTSSYFPVGIAFQTLLAPL